MKRTGSVLCPGCGTLVGVNDEQCLTCGRLRPGLWGITSALRSLGDDMGFASLVPWACGALYLASLVVHIGGIENQGILSFLMPSGRAAFLFGASGSTPIFVYGHWWSVLSAGWLHGSILHIVFNMMWVRDLVPAMARFYGPARTVIIYTVASVTGFLTSSMVNEIVGRDRDLPFGLGGSTLTLGASASIFGLMGALLYYGRRGGSFMISQYAKNLAITGAIFGFLMYRVDNWAHLGGFAGGYLCAMWLDPLKPERGDHAVVAVLCLLASLAAILASVVTGLPILRS